MRLLIVDREEKLSVSVRNRSLHIGDDRSVPLRLIDTVILASDVTLSNATLVALGVEGISVLLLRRYWGSIVVPMEGKNGELKLAQYRAAIDPMPIASWILERKILAHTCQLDIHGIRLPAEEFLKRIDEALTLEELLGIEGAFSRSYFRHYFKLFPKKLHKGRRSKNPPEDPLNALLSYLYTLVYHLIAVRLIGYGFEAGIGFLHRPFRSHYALASDLMELFRAEINERVYRFFHDGDLDSSDFTKRGTGVYLRRLPKQRLWSEIKAFHRELEPRIDESITILRRKICPDTD